MKTHLRLISRAGVWPQFKIACGNTAAGWIKHSTSNEANVTCARCQKIAHKNSEAKREAAVKIRDKVWDHAED